MKHAFYLLLTMFVFALPARALLPHKEHAPSQENTRGTHSLHRSGLESRAATFHKKIPKFLRPRLNPEDRYNVTTAGTFSVASAVFSLLCFGALALTASPFFLIPAFLFAVLASVFGAVGLNRHKRGFAILAFSLGILEIVAGIIVLALIL